MLLAKGANPDRSDTSSGYSAREQAARNTREQFGDGSVRKVMRKAIRDQAKANDKMAGQLLGNEDKLRAFTDLLVDMLYERFARRAKEGKR